MSFQQFAHGDFNIKLDVDGLRRLAEKVGPRVEDALSKIAHNAAAQAQRNIRAVNAIDTGYMINTTAARRIGPLEWSVGTAAEYGVYVEFGTRYVAPRPWLTPAMRQAQGDLDEVLGHALEDAAR